MTLRMNRGRGRGLISPADLVTAQCMHSTCCLTLWQHANFEGLLPWQPMCKQPLAALLVNFTFAGVFWFVGIFARPRCYPCTISSPDLILLDGVPITSWSPTRTSSKPQCQTRQLLSKHRLSLP